MEVVFLAMTFEGIMGMRSSNWFKVGIPQTDSSHGKKVRITVKNMRRHILNEGIRGAKERPSVESSQTPSATCGFHKRH